MDWLLLTLRLLLSATLLLAGFSKLLDIGGFSRVLRELRFLPWRLVRPLAVFVTALELALGGWLARGGPGLSLVAVCAGAMLLLFAIVVVAGLVRGQELECGCFGRLLGKRATWWTVGRSVTLGAMAAAVARWDDVASDRATGFLIVPVMVASVTGALLFVEVVSSIRSASLYRGRSPSMQ